MDTLIYKLQYWWYHYKLKYSAMMSIGSLVVYSIIAYCIRPSPGRFSDGMNTLGSTLLLIPLKFAVVLVIALSVVMPLMIVRYRDLTDGRDCLQDMHDTGRTYRQLIRFYSNSNPYKMNISDMPYGRWQDQEGVILGKVDNRVICRSAFANGGEGQNYALFALPGDGKTTCQIIPAAMRFGGSVLAVDIKGDIYNATHNLRRIKMFAPDNPDASCHYNPLADIQYMNMIERRRFLEQMAEVIVPEDKDSRYWHETARSLFIGIALYCINWDNKTTLPQIAREILKSNAVDWVKKIKDSDCEDAQDYTNGFWGSNEKNLSGAYGTLTSAVRSFATGGIAELLSDSEEMISPETLYKGYDIYLEIPQDKISIYAPVCSILLNAFLFSFMRREDVSSARFSNRKIRSVLMLIDEFPQLSIPYDFISAALSTLRSRGISIFLCQQSIAQLHKKYGSEQAFASLMDCIHNISIMSLQDVSSKKWAQELLGTRKVIRISTSSGGGSYEDMSRGSSSLNAQDDREPIFRAEEFGNLGDKVIIYMHGKYVLAEKTPWYK